MFLSVSMLSQLLTVNIARTLVGKSVLYEVQMYFYRFVLSFFVLQVLGALIVYGLFMYDVLQKDSGWEALDDIVYITRAIIHVTEFLVAVLVVGSGKLSSIKSTF